MSPNPLGPNRALYADEDGNFEVRDEVSSRDVAEDELLIENLFSGANAADIRHSTHLGIRPTVIGYDFCGRVISAPPSSEFSPGDLVAGYTPSGLGRAAKYGAHQHYLVCPEDMAFKVPERLPESHAAAITVVAMTAADVIFNLFNFPLPDSAAEHQGPILIWGASSSVGISALQFAKASGCRNIFVTASPARHELLKSLGATQAFDYSSPTVVQDITVAVEALGQGPITHALDAVGAAAPSVAQCVDDSTTVLSSVILIKDQRFRMPVAMTKDEWDIHPVGSPGPISIPSRPKDHWHAWEALKWAINNYGTEFRLPVVDVVEGSAEEALQEVTKVATLGRGFGKVVIRHPMN